MTVTVSNWSTGSSFFVGRDVHCFSLAFSANTSEYLTFIGMISEIRKVFLEQKFVEHYIWTHQCETA